MPSWKLLIFSCLISILSFGQQCPDLLNPTAGSSNVPVDTDISWEPVVGVTGYLISIGTTPGGGEIVNEQAVGSATTFSPPLGLPESTVIYVTLTLFIFDQPDVECPAISFTTEDVSTVPDCTQLSTPLDGDTGVNVGVILNWDYASRATGYRVTIGTTPGSGDIVNDLDVGNVLSFDPSGDLPPGTLIYVSIVPYNENGDAVGCAEESFTTGSLGDPPGCTRLISPEDGEINVELSPRIEWEPAPGATGYIVNIGRTPFINDILDGVVYTTTFILVLNFDPNSTYFVEIIPFNDAGQAQGCPQESFSTILGCGPFFDEATGELVILNPEINFPDRVGICDNDLPTEITTSDAADGFRWYKIIDTDEEVLIGEGPSVGISEEGQYRYVAYNEIDQDGVEIECPTSKLFTVVSSSIAMIERIRIEEEEDLFEVEIVISGSGDYEFALNDRNGPYQDDNRFTGLSIGDYVVYVRDKSGCGTVSEAFVLAYPPTGFPPYFSPNGDGINDYWNYIPPRDGEPLPLKLISIFDRYGKLLGQINPGSQGWDGRFNNNPLPSEGYWYKAETTDNRVITGHFSLVR